MKIEFTDSDGNIVHADLPDDHPVAEALRGDGPYRTREEWALIRDGDPCTEHAGRCWNGEP